MKILTLLRQPSTMGSTFGILHGKGVLLHVMELGRKDNAREISCIPAGGYLVKRDHSGQHKYYKVADVEGRTDIEFHRANKPQELKGCIGLGLGFTYRNSKPSGLTSSRDACNVLVSIMGDDDWILHIESGDKIEKG